MILVKCNLTLNKEQFNKYTKFLVWLKKDRDLKSFKINKEALKEFDKVIE